MTAVGVSWGLPRDEPRTILGLNRSRLSPTTFHMVTLFAQSLSGKHSRATTYRLPSMNTGTSRNAL